jgi:hypothetical protein
MLKASCERGAGVHRAREETTMSKASVKVALFVRLEAGPFSSL